MSNVFSTRYYKDMSRPFYKNKASYFYTYVGFTDKDGNLGVSSGVDCYFLPMINATKYKKMIITGATTWAGASGYNVWAGLSKKNTEFTNDNVRIENGTYTIDISSYTGEYYIYSRAYWAEGYISEIRFE